MSLFLNDDPLRWLSAAGLLASWAALAAISWRKDANERASSGNAQLSADGEGQIAVIHASQTGFAQELAEQAAARLRRAGLSATACDLASAGADLCAGRIRSALFIASTCGEGDAPDSASRFFSQHMLAPAALAGLDYGLLALGDRDYQDYCAFGRRLDSWLRDSGARPRWPRIEVDNADPQALADWAARLDHLAGDGHQVAALAEDFADWTLAGREVMNPGSLGEPIWRLRLQPPAGLDADWQAGDLLQIRPPAGLAEPGSAGAEPPEPAGAGTAATRVAETRTGEGRITATRAADKPASRPVASAPRPRDYSIASLPASGEVELLVRRHRAADGRSGRCSGWLGDQLQIGDRVPARLRVHAGFRLGDNARRPLLLIGNGTGLAGLLAHLRQRIAAGETRNWLIFGERQRQPDFLCAAELQRWQAGGELLHLDLAFSRDGGGYVQDQLAAQAARLRRWVDRGAAIYVCGNARGMAPAVDAALRAILGDADVDALMASGRYRRDVY